MGVKAKPKKLKSSEEYVSGTGSDIDSNLTAEKLRQSKASKGTKKMAKDKKDQKPKWYFGRGAKKLVGSTKRRLEKLRKKGKVTDPSGKVVTEKYTSPLGKSVEGETGRIRRKPQSAVKTKGGTFPTYKKKSGAAKSFRQAFKEARAKSPGSVFEWDGRKYKAETAEDVAKRKKTKKVETKEMGGYRREYSEGGSVGTPVATYAWGGYVEGE